MPATLTVTVLVRVPFTPVTVRVYVVVAAGVTLSTPRAVARPMVGSIVVVRGFSTAHVSVVDSPGLIELGSALKSMIRAGSVPAS